MPDTNWTVADGDAGVRLDKFLAGGERLGSRARAVAALERGKVYVNGAEAALGDASRRLVPGDVVRLWIDRPGSARRRPRLGPAGDLDVVYEDDELIVVNKPPGLLAVPLERKSEAPSVYEQIEERFRPHGKRRPFVVHRIDQDTSGLVVFAKNELSQRALKAQFKRQEPSRVYWAVVYGTPERSAGTWRDFLVWDDKALIQKETHPRDPRATEAVCAYRVIEPFGPATLIEVKLRTGRRNQIRIQARLRGPHARRRAAVRVRSRHAAADRVRTSRPPRVPADGAAPDRRTAARSGGRAAGGLHGAAGAAAVGESLIPNP